MYVDVVHEDLRVAPGAAAAAAGAAAGLLINCRTWTRGYDELVLRGRRAAGVTHKRSPCDDTSAARQEVASNNVL